MSLYMPFKTLLLLLLLCSTVMAVQADDGGMKMLGKGVGRYLGVVKVYEARLYAENSEAAGVLHPDVSKCLELHYEVGLKKKNFVDAANTTLSRIHSAEILDLFKKETDALHKAYVPVKKGDTYRLCYDAETMTTTLELNTEKLVSVVSRNFSSFYFGIWLDNENSLDKSLQKQLVGTM